MSAERNRERFPVMAELVDALRGAGIECRVVHAREGAEEAGAPLSGVEWVTPDLGMPEAPATPRAPARAVTAEGAKLLRDVARAEASRFRAMSPASRARYLKFTGPGWWTLLDPKRRAQIEALDSTPANDR